MPRGKPLRDPRYINLYTAAAIAANIALHGPLPAAVVAAMAPALAPAPAAVAAPAVAAVANVPFNIAGLSVTDVLAMLTAGGVSLKYLLGLHSDYQKNPEQWAESVFLPLMRVISSKDKAKKFDPIPMTDPEKEEHMRRQEQKNIDEHNVKEYLQEFEPRQYAALQAMEKTQSDIWQKAGEMWGKLQESMAPNDFQKFRTGITDEERAGQPTPFEEWIVSIMPQEEEKAAGGFHEPFSLKGGTCGGCETCGALPEIVRKIVKEVLAETKPEKEEPAAGCRSGCEAVLQQYSKDKAKLMAGAAEPIKDKIYAAYEVILKAMDGDATAILEIEMDKPELIDNLFEAINELEKLEKEVTVAAGGDILVDDSAAPPPKVIIGAAKKKSKKIKKTVNNSWVNHVKAYAAKHDLKYFDALKPARASYKGGMHPGIKMI